MTTQTVIIMMDADIDADWEETITDDSEDEVHTTSAQATKSLGEIAAGKTIRGILAIALADTIRYAVVKRAGQVVLAIPCTHGGRSGRVPPLPRPYKVQSNDVMVVWTEGGA